MSDKTAPRSFSFPSAEVDSYAAIQNFLGQLPPPAAGKKRMFRGQTTGYYDALTGLPKLLPALSRDNSDHTYDPAWLVSIQMYTMAIDEHGASTPYEQVYLWGPALLQHYGPGSSYLDVSSDLDTALWFALYKRHEKWLALPHPSGIPHTHCCAWHTPADLAEAVIAPVLYIFDAAPWNGEGAPAHGELVELTALNVAGKLPQEARRLQHQVASLLFSDLKHPDGPNLGPEIVAMLFLTPPFDKTSVPSFGRSAGDIFPSPAADPFYRSLLQVPAQLRFEPRRVEHPLYVPCYLDEPPELPASTAKGDRRSPQLISAADAANIAGFNSFAELGNSLEPLLMFQFAVQNAESFGEPVIPTTDEGQQFRLADATPFLMEGPLWSYLPSCHTEETRGQWIQSALPIGIAPTLAGRPTDNIYIEMSTIDVQYPQKEDPGPPGSNSSAVRGIWTVRSGDHYMVTVYRTGDGGVMSMAVPYRFIPAVGEFIRVAPEAENSLSQQERDNLKPHFDVAEKALFTSLLLLRELSPGPKPPSTFALSFLCKDDSFARLVGEDLEPPLGIIATPKDSPFLIPRALNGSTYARSSGADAVDRDAWRKSPEGLSALLNAVQHVKEPLYLIDAGAELANLLAEDNQLAHALDVARYALAQTTPLTMATRTFAAVLEVLQGRLLFTLKDHPNALRAFERAIAIYQQSGDQDKVAETQGLINKLFPATPG
jgi:FRG domain